VSKSGMFFLRSLTVQICVLALLVSSCTQEEVLNHGIGAAIGAGVGLIQAESLTPEAEAKLGAQMRIQVLQEYPLYTSSTALVDYVRAIGASLASHAERRKEYNFSFDIVESKEINAFTIPGGSIYITTELLKYLANEGELAAVLAHEIGHIDGQHPKESLRRALIAQGLVEGGLSDQQLLSVVASLTLELIQRGFSREQELEADRLGVVLATGINYAESAMSSFFQTLLNNEGQSPNGLVMLLQTHPATTERIAVIHQFIIDNHIRAQFPILNTQAYEAKIAVLPAKEPLPGLSGN
jgi:beta-barrel assembly-enhancing protease